ncbi:uncharacterized protein N7482_004015 [Penicillium canariense]|uniref:RING-type domain-containing protein n=1 Tax=Penicillium canariense TaxID=189055 RepID=A0A9W9I7M2_9EURO|nr:uncharacterized protein N7482_004015 [Penicillium canariense]KAJ5168421.1 hypothetical protein N7482_004015 [Penicillium canariense]
MSQVQQGLGLADLEKELGCSICTELLYQPLTLLDCLHTFCGSCLKEWFTAQGSRRRPSGTSPRFTCPSCRAEVRGTRPNATVTTLLDMVLVSQPDRARSAPEKEEIAEKYHPGDSVFPPPQDDNESEEDEDDRRILEEIQELSLRESRAQARREARRGGHSDRTRERSSNPERPQRTSRTHGDAERARRVEHQSSLRSLLSLSSEAETMEEEILRQIIEEGLLDDVDFENLSSTQEEELSERIADAYRRRHMQQPRDSQGQRRRQSPEDASRTHSRSQSAQRPDETTTSTTSRDQNNRRPPASRPHLLDPTTQRPTPSHHRRNSEQLGERRGPSPTRVNQASNSEDTLRPAVRSSSDMTAERTRSSQNARSRVESSSTRPRRATESDEGISDVWMGGGRERSSSRNVTSQSITDSPTSVSSPQLGPPISTPTDHSAPASSSPLVPARSDRRPRSSRSNVPAPSNAQYVEPSISCDRCGKANIQYDLHKKCPKCKDGDYHLCLRCYRTGLGCLQWTGFGSSAEETYKRILASSNHRSVQVRETGHVLGSYKYGRPPETAQLITNGERKLTNDNPARRLKSGLFCDICQNPANECFWKCSQCNEGDWGFCNRCVNQGRCCTHPLLPIRRMTSHPTASATSTPADANSLSGPSGSESFKILSFSTKCDICTYPIPASVTRFHCLQCNDGDYDVCTNCYLKLVATSKISKENGHNGWRRCISGHRMIVVGFEDHDDGQRRVIVRDLVGGHALQDEHVGPSPSSSPASGVPAASPELGTGHWSWKEGQERRKKIARLRGPSTLPNSSSSNAPSSEPSQSTGTPTSQHTPPFRRFPPDGGVGFIVRARWFFYPEEGVEDELFFPSGADIKEVDIINDDWYWGCYAGRKGLFFGKRVEVIGEIQ